MAVGGKLKLIAVGESAAFADEGGSTRIERPAHQVVRFTTTGHLSDGLSRFALDHSALLVDDIGSGLAGFYDWEGMSSYASSARSDSTSFMLKHRKRYRCALILTGSPIVAMGVNVANVVLGGFLTATTRRAEFEALYRDACD